MKTPADFLKEDFESRRLKNPRFSLRSYARFLELNPGSLSHLMTGKRLPKGTQISKLAEKMNLDEATILFWEDLAANCRTQIQSDKFLSEKEINTLNTPYFYALVELFSIKASWSEDEITDALGIEKKQVKHLITVLKKQDILEEKNHRLRARKKALSTFEIPRTSATLKELQAQMLKLSVEKMYDIEIEKRHQSTLTFAISENDVEAFKKKLRKLHREFSQTASNSKSEPNSVYNLVLSFYPISKPITKIRKTAVAKK